MDQYNNNKQESKQTILTLLSKQFKKASLELFLKEQYRDLMRRSDDESRENNLSKLAFMEFIQLPLIIAERCFYAFTNHRNAIEISKEKYVDGFRDIYGDDLEKKLEIISRIFDFDLDGVLNVDDITMLFAQFYVIEHDFSTFQEIKDIIHVKLTPRKRLTTSSFKDILLNYNPDALYLFIIYLNHFCPFTEDQVNYFNRTGNMNEMSIGNNSNHNHNHKKLTNRFNGIPPTSKLSSYLKANKLIIDENNLIKDPKDDNTGNTNKNKNKDNDDNEDETESINSELDDLDFFENDLAITMSTINHNKTAEKKQERKASDAYSIQSISTFSKFKTSHSPITNPSQQKQSYVRSSTKSPVKNKNSNGDGYNKLQSLAPNSMQNNNCQEIIGDYLNQNNFFEIKVNYYTRSGAVRDCKILIIDNCLFVHIFNGFTYKFLKLINMKFTFVEEIEKCETLSKNILTRVKLSSFLNGNYKEMVFSSQEQIEMASFITHLKYLTNFRSLNDIYTISKELYRGSMSHLFIGQNNKTNQKVAIKQVYQTKLDKSKMYEILLWEFDIMKFIKKTSHSNIVKVYDLYRTQEALYFVLEYIQGGNLKNYLLNNRSMLTNKDYKKIMFQISNSVFFLHSHGIVHRDLKPENILVDKNEENDEINIKLIDFGFSKVLGRLDFANESYGTLSYASPEVLNKTPYSFKADVWSVGVIFYYTLVGTHPFGETDKELKMIHSNILNASYTIPNKVDSKFKEIIKACLNIEAKERPKMEDIVKLLI